MRNLIKPKRLSEGDLVTTISSSWGGAELYPERYQIAKSRLESIFGLKVVETTHALASPEYLYNNPQQRAKDLMNAFSDKNIKAIFSNIGGDDSIRMLPYLDFAVIKNNPKIFMGFSDSTVTHFICLKAGLSSFYGTSILCGFAENVQMYPYEQRAIKSILFKTENIPILIENNLDGWTDEFLDWGNPDFYQIRRKLRSPSEYKFLGSDNLAQGYLLGGCVEVLSILNGTPLWPDLAAWDDVVLFLETAGGYKHSELKGFLRSLGAQGILPKLKGVLFSKPGGEISIDPRNWPLYDEVILKVLHEYNCNIPVVTNMDFGHTSPMTVLPYGAKVEINSSLRTITIIDVVQ